ncbi:Uncharacterised protein [Yersinia enterocolitica]|nr:Uncharacterised protein [Yersinia enterocolitica]
MSRLASRFGNACTIRRDRPLKRLSQLTTQAGFIRALPHFSYIREALSPGPSEEDPGNILI